MNKELTTYNETVPSVVPDQDSQLKAVVEKMGLSERDSRDLLFSLLVLIKGMSPTAAGKQVGIQNGSRLWSDLNNQKSGSGLIHKYMQKQQDAFRLKTVAKLDQVGEIEDKVLKMLAETPEMASKFPAMLRSIKNVGGVLRDEFPPQPTIHIESVAQLMMNVQPMTVDEVK
jgi:hypothetical protein